MRWLSSSIACLDEDSRETSAALADTLAPPAGRVRVRRGRPTLRLPRGVALELPTDGHSTACPRRRRFRSLRRRGLPTRSAGTTWPCCRARASVARLPTWADFPVVPPCLGCGRRRCPDRGGTPAADQAGSGGNPVPVRHERQDDVLADPQVCTRAAVPRRPQRRHLDDHTGELGDRAQLALDQCRHGREPDPVAVARDRMSAEVNMEITMVLIRAPPRGLRARSGLALSHRVGPYTELLGELVRAEPERVPDHDRGCERVLSGRGADQVAE